LNFLRLRVFALYWFACSARARCPRDARLQAGLTNRFLIERRGAFDWKCCQSGKHFSQIENHFRQFAMRALNQLGGKHGVGRVDMVENSRFAGWE